MFKKRRSIKLGKGVRLNVGKKGITSLSVGRKGLAVNAGKKGVKATVNIRGTGLSASKYITKSKSNFKEPEERTSRIKMDTHQLKH
ncbi:DUF4236 domain-containing protein [Microbulbifer thermotolerans]|uniref:DUF4236 domain-containing protein n=1 Tax=Microbulbifer thermotolerans TaxID=252514 RepID=A0A143HNZ5_MICTH|nr:DUF4236 domain-containing protein [Microbulbifer thermotolerans]AMX03454.1 hypothetical protein A3224_13500 [Microbulbifer thermotolerans]